MRCEINTGDSLKELGMLKTRGINKMKNSRERLKSTLNNQLLSWKAGLRQSPRKNESTKRKSRRNVQRYENQSTSKEPPTI